MSGSSFVIQNRQDRLMPCGRCETDARSVVMGPSARIADAPLCFHLLDGKLKEVMDRTIPSIARIFGMKTVGRLNFGCIDWGWSAKNC